MADALECAKKGDWEGAVEALRGRLSGIDWSDDAPPSAALDSDNEVLRAINHCHEARLMGKMEPVFIRFALLAIEALDTGNSDEYDTLTGVHGAIAETELGY